MKRYWPLASTVAEMRMPLAASSAVTVPLGITAPVGSDTVPLRLPEAPTPWACAIGLANNRDAASITATAQINEIRTLMAPPNVWDSCEIGTAGNSHQRDARPRTRR